MKLETYLKRQFTESGMRISDEALQLMIQEITNYVEDVTRDTLALGMHKTLMGNDVDLALMIRGEA